jgi:hypothetical protein
VRAFGHPYTLAKSPHAAWLTGQRRRAEMLV